MHYLDFIVIGIYLIAILSSIYFQKSKQNLESYFINNRQTKLFSLACACFSTSVGAGVVLGTASATFSSGISYGVLLIVITSLGWILAAYFAPKIKQFADKNQSYTMSDFFAIKYNESVRKISRIIILSAFFILTSLQFIALSQIIQTFSDLNHLSSLLIIALITIIYTSLGGLKATINTGIIQTICISFIFCLLLFKGFQILDINNLLKLPKEFFNLHNFGGATFFWTAIVLGIPLVLCSADTWQRIFAAENEKTAQKSLYLTAILKTIILTMSLLIGLLSFHLVPTSAADGAIFALMQKLLTPGLLGLGIVSLAAIVMSTIDSSLIIGSTTITKDFIQKIYPQTDHQKILKISKITTFLFGIASLAVAYYAKSIVILTIVSAQILLIFTPALLGNLIWNNQNTKAAYYSMLLGFITTIGFIFINPKTAFIPGLLIATLTYLFFSLKSKWSKSTIKI